MNSRQGATALEASCQEAALARVCPVSYMPFLNQLSYLSPKCNSIGKQLFFPGHKHFCSRGHQGD